MKRGFINFGRLDLSVDADLEKARRLERRTAARQHVRDLRPRGFRATISATSPPSARSRRCRTPRLKEPISADASPGRRAVDQGRPAGRRRRVLRQPDRRPVRQRHVRLAGHQGDQPAGRRTAPPIAVPGIRFKAQPVEGVTRFRRDLQRQPGQSRRRRSAAARQSRPGVSPARSALADRPGALGLFVGDRRHEPARQLHARHTGTTSVSSTASASPRTASRSPIQTAAASRRSFAATTATSRCWSRRCTGPRR